MSSDYTGSTGTTTLTIPLPDDGDRPSAQLFRDAFEPIIDTLADLDARSIGDGSGGGSISSGETLEVDGDINVNGPNGDIFIKSGATLTVQSGGDILAQSGSTTTFAAGSTVSVATEVDLISGAILDVNNGGAVNIASGADINVTTGGEINMLSGAVIDMNNGSSMTLASGASIVGSAGSEVDVASSDDIVINGVTGTAFSARHSLTPLQQTLPEAWEPFSGNVGVWVDSAADGASLIAFAIRALPGDVLTDIKVRVTGQVGVSGHAGLPGTPVRATAVTIDVNGAVTPLDAANDPSGSAGAFNTPHDITLNGGSFPFTVTGDPILVTVRSEGDANAEVNKTAILSIRSNGVAHKFRNTVEFL